MVGFKYQTNNKTGIITVFHGFILCSFPSLSLVVASFTEFPKFFFTFIASFVTLFGAGILGRAHVTFNDNYHFIRCCAKPKHRWYYSRVITTAVSNTIQANGMTVTIVQIGKYLFCFISGLGMRWSISRLCTNNQCDPESSNN